MAVSKRKPSSAKIRPARKPGGYHHGDLVRVLVEAALALITERGLHDFSLREVARRAGVSTAAPYWHFRDRDALLGAVAAACAERWLTAMRNAVEGHPADQPLRRLQATGIAHVRFAVENPAHFWVMEMPFVRDRMPPSARAQLEAFYEEESVRLVAAQDRGLLAPLSLDLLKLATRSLVNGLAYLMISDDPQVRRLTPARVLEVAEQVTRVLGVGLLPRPPTPRP